METVFDDSSLSVASIRAARCCDSTHSTRATHLEFYFTN